MISRSYNGTTATLSYDGLDHLTTYDAGSNGQEQYVYDAGGSRVLRRSTSSGITSMTVYAFGLEEHLYSGSGVHQSDTYYYNLGGMLVGESTSSGTNMFLTDALGSVIETISATANTAAVQGNQVYSPYGSSRYQQGSMGTAKGFTGQYNDAATGLDYYNARYYDPVVGRFLSIDKATGNMQGADPYAYVGGNPETKNDPTGQFFAPPPSVGAPPPPPPPPPSNSSSGSQTGSGAGSDLPTSTKIKAISLIGRFLVSVGKSQVDARLLQNPFAGCVDLFASVYCAVPISDDEGLLSRFLYNIVSRSGKFNVNSGLSDLGAWGGYAKGLSKVLGFAGDSLGVGFAGADLYEQLILPANQRNYVEIVADAAVIGSVVISWFLKSLKQPELASKVSFALGLVAFAGYATVFMEDLANSSTPPSNNNGDDQGRNERHGGGGGGPPLPPLFPASAFFPPLLNPNGSEPEGPAFPGGITPLPVLI